jgi:hypothetical protein
MHEISWPVSLLILIVPVLLVALGFRVAWRLLPTARRQVVAFQQLAREMRGTFSQAFFSRSPRVRAPYGSGRLVVELATDADDTPQTLVTVEGMDSLDRKFFLRITPKADFNQLEMRKDGILAVRTLLALAPTGRARIYCRPKGLLEPAKAVVEFEGLLADRGDFVAAIRTTAAALERIVEARSIW